MATKKTTTQNPAASRPRLSLVESTSRETINTLERLLERARSGEVVGLAFSAVLRGRSYMVDLVGETRRDLTSTRGMVCALDDELRRLVEEQADANPTVQSFD